MHSVTIVHHGSQQNALCNEGYYVHSECCMPAWLQDANPVGVGAWGFTADSKRA